MPIEWRDMAWLVLRHRRHEGPFNTDALAEQCQSGALHPQDFIIDSGDLDRGNMRYRKIVEILPSLAVVPTDPRAGGKPSDAPVASAPATPALKRSPTLSGAKPVDRYRPSVQAAAAKPAEPPRGAESGSRDSAHVVVTSGASRFTPEFKRNAVAGVVILGVCLGAVLGYEKFNDGKASRNLASQEDGAPTPAKVAPRSRSSEAGSSRRPRPSCSDVSLRVPSLPEAPRPSAPMAEPEPPPPVESSPSNVAVDLPQPNNDLLEGTSAPPQAPEISQAAEIAPDNFADNPSTNDHNGYNPDNGGVSPASDGPMTPVEEAPPPGPAY